MDTGILLLAFFTLELEMDHPSESSLCTVARALPTDTLLFFKKIIFKLTIYIPMCKIILEVEYFIKSMIYQMLKFFKRIAYFIPR